MKFIQYHISADTTGSELTQSYILQCSRALHSRALHRRMLYHLAMTLLPQIRMNLVGQVFNRYVLACGKYGAKWNTPSRVISLKSLWVIWIAFLSISTFRIFKSLAMQPPTAHSSPVPPTMVSGLQTSLVLPSGVQTSVVPPPGVQTSVVPAPGVLTLT